MEERVEVLLSEVGRLSDGRQCKQHGGKRDKRNTKTHTPDGRGGRGGEGMKRQLEETEDVDGMQLADGGRDGIGGK